MNTIIAAAIAISLALGYGLWSWNKIDSLEEKNTELTVQIKQAEKQKKIDDSIILELDRKKAEVRIVKEEVIREVTKYEKNPNAGKCMLPADFVRIHDLSLSGATSGTNEAPKASGPAEPVNDIRVLEVSTENNTRARDNIIQCESLMKWVQEVSKK